MNQALAIQPANEYTITFLNGQDRGAVFRMVAKKIKLGRGTDNDIIINGDPKVSRNHAKISVTENGVIITDTSDHNRMLVGTLEVKSHELKDGSEFTLGDTRFRFNFVTNLPVPPPIPAAPPTPKLAVAPPADVMAPKPKRPTPRQSAQGDNRLAFYGVIGVVAAIFIWLFSGPSAQQKAQVQLRTDQQIEADIKAAQDLSAAQERERQQQGKDSIQYKKAQTHFVQGFRDYQVGQFERALESFQACLSIYPAHLMCHRYQGLSQKRYSELVQYHMILGRQYFGQNQFKACMASFRNVLFMVRDPNSAIYKEALVNFQNCQRMQEDRF